MTSLLTNTAAMTALMTLKSLKSQVDVTSNRISTGQRVSNAADNAAYWSIATSVRSDNAALGAVKDSLGFGLASVDIAYNGLTSVLGDLTNLRAKLQTALTPGVDRAKVQTEINAIQAKMVATAQSSVSSGQNWLAVDSSATNPAFDPSPSLIAGFSRTGATAVSFSSIDIDVNKIKLYDAASTSISVQGTPARITGSSAIPGLLDLSGSREVKFTLRIDGGSGQDIVLNRTTLASAVPDLAHIIPSQIVRAINNEIAANAILNGAVQAGLDSAGRLWFETTSTGDARSLIIDRVSTGSAAASTNLVTNGEFETTYVGWSATDTTYVQVAPLPHGGVASLALGTVNAPTRLTQTIATVPGQSYTFSFWLQNDGGTPSSFEASWNGASLLSLSNSPAQPFTPYQFTVTASGTSTVLEFAAQQVPAFWHLDDVTVTAVSDGLTFGYGSGSSDQRAGYGTDPATKSARGLLDTVDSHTGVSVQTIDLNELGVAGAGDAMLKDIISQVEGVIARVTDASTLLGANKTQLSGQSTFVYTLIKANERAIGILTDADIEEESTRTKALQTQQQLAMQSLSIANSSSQSILSLFQ